MYDLCGWIPSCNLRTSNFFFFFSFIQLQVKEKRREERPGIKKLSFEAKYNWAGILVPEFISCVTWASYLNCLILSFFRYTMGKSKHLLHLAVMRIKYIYKGHL